MAILAGLLAAIAGLSAALVSAGGTDPHAVPSQGEVAARVMSPFCPGLSLEECPSDEATELRSRIAGRIEAGATNREIDRWLVADYGESVLARPPGSVSWIVPAAFVLAGFAALLFGLSFRAPRATTAVNHSPQGGDPDGSLSAYRPQMLEDLSRFAEGTE